jgi:hypothetical protein
MREEVTGRRKEIHVSPAPVSRREKYIFWKRFSLLLLGQCHH